MDYTFSDMTDIPVLQDLMASLYRASGIPCGIIDVDGKVLVATGWREICTRFHRVHPATEILCQESDAFIAEHLRREEKLPACGYLEYRCKNGMIDIAVPIVIDGRHLANLFLGQFFYSPPDADFFARQARRYGFDEEKYLEALRSVPIFTRQKVEDILAYQIRLVHLLIRMGHERLERVRAEEERRRMHERLEQAQRIARLGSWEWDPVTGDMLWNSQVFNNFGLNPESFQPSYRGFLENVHPEDRAMVRRSVEQARETGEVWVEHRIVRPDGAIRYLLEQGQVVHDEDRNGSRMMGICYDVTEQKQVEIALIESERRLQDILDHSHMLVYLKDLEGRFLFVNQHFEKLFHLERGAALKKTDAELFSSEAAAAYTRNDRIVSHGRAIQQFEEVLVQDDGLHTYLSVKFPLHDSQGRIYAICGLSTDITERKLAEEQVVEALNLAEAARDHLHAVFEAVTDGLIVTGLDRRIALLNRAAERLLDSRAPLLNRAVADLAEAPLREQIEAVFSGRDPGLSTDLALTHREGQLMVQIRSTAVFSEQGQRIGVITMLRDVTRERELDRMKNEFISTAAHELRTPLTSVLGFAQVLFNAADYGLSDPRQQRELLGHIVEKGISLKGIIDDLFDLSRVQAGQLLSLSREPSDVCGLLRQLVDSYQRSYGSHVFDILLPDECPVVLVDQKKLSQVMENLLSNAVKFSPEGSVVKISAQVGVGFFQVCVADRGIGMTAEQKARMFDKFYRADASNTARGGLGLGMSIVKNIITGHDGRIWVESEPGRGTQVFFTLPLTDVPVLTDSP